MIVTLKQQREMIVKQMEKCKAEGMDTEYNNAQFDLRRFDAAKATGLKCKDKDGNIYETFSWFYIAPNGGKRWQHGHKYEGEFRLLTRNVRKAECFK